MNNMPYLAGVINETLRYLTSLLFSDAALFVFTVLRLLLMVILIVISFAVGVCSLNSSLIVACDGVLSTVSLSLFFRLWPPVPIDTKVAAKDDVLPNGMFVKKGVRV